MNLLYRKSFHDIPAPRPCSVYGFRHHIHAPGTSVALRPFAASSLNYYNSTTITPKIQFQLYSILRSLSDTGYKPEWPCFSAVEIPPQALHRLFRILYHTHMPCTHCSPCRRRIAVPLLSGSRIRHCRISFSSDTRLTFSGHLTAPDPLIFLILSKVTCHDRMFPV